MRRCPKCGFIIENENAQFCKICGRRLPPIVPMDNTSDKENDIQDNVCVPNNEVPVIGDGVVSQSGRIKEIIHSICMVILAALIALGLPLCSTVYVNRFVAFITGQWYLNRFTRIMITIVMTILTYFLSYQFIRRTIFQKSVVFNVACIILTFLWTAFVGMMFMP